MALVINSAARPYESSRKRDNEREGATDREKMGSEEDGKGKREMTEGRMREKREMSR